jgi:hypothetical protein
VVSPATRVAVKLPRLDVPVVTSLLDDAPFTVRCVLVDARPVVVRSLALVTVVLADTIVAVSPRSSAPRAPRLPAHPARRAARSRSRPARAPACRRR